MKHFLTSSSLLFVGILKQIVIYSGLLLAIPFIIVVLACLIPYGVLFIAWTTFDKAEISLSKPVKVLFLQD